MNVPVLARLLEAAGFATIMVTMMPYFAELAGTPRTLAVEFPFGQTLGYDAAQQMRVVREALEVLATAVAPNTIIHSSEEWPIPQKEAYKTWQPSEPSPIIAVMATQLRTMLRQNR
jgi:hypothetical protein